MKLLKYINIQMCYFKLLKSVILLPLLLILMLQPAVFGLTVDMTPENVSIGIMYHGSELVVTGQYNPDEKIILKISSALGESHLKYKGKTGGLFWMKKGDMIFKPVPSVYIVQAPDQLDNLLSREQQSEYRLGYKALSEHIEIESSHQDIDKAFWVSEFIKYKENENLYNLKTLDPAISEAKTNGQFRYLVDWPYQAVPGTYRLEVFAVKDKQIVGQSEKLFQVERSGLVAFLSNMAFNQAAWYGIVAIVTAGLAGFLVGFVFKGGGSH